MPKRQKTNNGQSVTVIPRNAIALNPLMRRGGVHRKSNSAKRAADRREIRRQSRDWSSFFDLIRGLF